MEIKLDKVTYINSYAAVRTTNLVLPEELDLRHGDEVGAAPDLDEHELTDGEDLRLLCHLIPELVIKNAPLPEKK